MHSWVSPAKLQPPRLVGPLLRRPRLQARLQAGKKRPFTLIQAGAGYGKSTLAAAFLAEQDAPFAWYSLSERDADLSTFVAHLLAALERIVPALGDEVFSFFDKARSGEIPWPLFADILNGQVARRLRQNAWLVLDDVHLVAHRQPVQDFLEALFASVPDHLHYLLTTRHRLSLASLADATAKGYVVYLTTADLALTPEEVKTLFRDHFFVTLTDEQVARLHAETEGWVLALHLLGHRLRGKGAQQVTAALDDLPGRLEVLFDYLTESVLARMRPEMRAFLLETSVLRFLEAAACDAVRRTRGSERLLRKVLDSGIGLVQVDATTYRHHHLVHEFLQRHLQQDERAWRALHRRAAAYFSGQGNWEEAIHHLLAAHDYSAAAHHISALAEQLIGTGRLMTLDAWLSSLPDTLLDEQPDLRVVQGHVARLLSRYDQATVWYQRAEAQFAAQGDVLGLSRALEGQALIYIDTVRPAPAEALLKRALRALGRHHPAESGRLLRLMAENAVNRGHPGLAARWYTAAQRLDETRDTYLEVRIRLRSGRLAEARALLEPEISKPAGTRPARTHREPCLLLSLIDVLQGDVEDARRQAERGLQLARRFYSPFTEAVAHMRLGHAWQLPPRPDVERARQHYEVALSLVRQLNVIRGEAEPLFGLTLLHAFNRQWQAARSAARRGLEIAERAGDHWVTGLLHLAMGIADALHAPAETATAQLQRALTLLEACGDAFGVTLAHMWLAWLAHHHDDEARFSQHAREWLVRAGEYPFLATRATLFGFRDPQWSVPLMIAARAKGILPVLVERRLFQLSLPSQIAYHPGYTLRVQTLGTFVVWRGDEPVLDQEWRREKARRLFQLLLVHRGRFLQREQIIDYLWPDTPLKSAETHFKVALNALHRALEPHRRRGDAPFFVVRHESTYGLNPAAAIEWDVDLFLKGLAEADHLSTTQPDEAIPRYQEALALYSGTFLPDALYEDWTHSLRERLTRRYLEGAEALARLLVSHAPHEALTWCERMWEVDPLWEPAYQVAMRAYYVLGLRHMVVRTYRQCAELLRRELNVAPAEETTRLLHALVDERVEVSSTRSP